MEGRKPLMSHETGEGYRSRDRKAQKPTTVKANTIKSPQNDIVRERDTKGQVSHETGIYRGST